jgi:hypothetical protein
MARQHYQRLSPTDIDEIWRRLRSGHSVKPTARALGLATSTVGTYLIRCGGIRPDPRHRSVCRLSIEEREEISRRPGRRTLAADDRGGTGTLGVDDQSRGRWQRRPSPVPSRDREPAGVGQGDASEGVQADSESGAGWHRDREAPTPVVTATDRRLVEADLSRRPGDARVAREHLPHVVRAVAWRSAQKS